MAKANGNGKIKTGVAAGSIETEIGDLAGLFTAPREVRDSGTGGAHSFEATIKAIPNIDVDRLTFSTDVLYKPVDERVPSTRTARLLEVLLQAKSGLDKALSHEIEEIERESIVPQVATVLDRATTLSHGYGRTEEALTAIGVAITSRAIEGYERRHVYAVWKSIITIIDNPVLSEAQLHKTIDILEKEGFDVSIPLKGVDIG